MRRLLIGLLGLLLLSSTGACGGYSQRLETARLSAQSGALDRALASVDELVARGRSGRSPQDKDLPLLLLERAAILQALGDHEGATADFAEADAMLEVLDLTPDRAGKAAEYLFSDARKLYRPPIYEKLTLNVMALSSYLAQGQIRSAVVEARRIGVLLEYFDDAGAGDHPMIGAAAYLAGIASERAGEGQSALRFYLRAWGLMDAPGLAEAVVRLGHASPVAPDSEVARARQTLGLGPDEVPRAPAQEVITIAFSGMAPYRIAERLPVGVVFAWMRQNAAYSLGVDDQATYNRILAEGLLTWVNFPSLVVQHNARAQPWVSVDGRSSTGALVADFEAFALDQWERERPGVAFAAITRAITRVVAREAIQAIGNAGNQTTRTIGFIASLAAQGAMQAADQPDTRTWSLMPAYLWVARTPVQPGSHTVEVRVGGTTRVVPVEVTPGRSAAVVVRSF